MQLVSPGFEGIGPCVVGATGGSATRVVARIMRAAGLYMGELLNETEDALPVAEALNLWLNPYLLSRDTRLAWLGEQALLLALRRALGKHLAPLAGSLRPWGWKEPRTIYLLPVLAPRLPEMRFLHLVRDGRDMALSPNQNQLVRHGLAVLDPETQQWSRLPRSVALWSRVNVEAAEYGQRVLADRYLLVRFEDLCCDPVRETRRILAFFDLQGDATEIAASHVMAPASVGRWRRLQPDTVIALQRIGGEGLRRFGYW